MESSELLSIFDAALDAVRPIQLSRLRSIFGMALKQLELDLDKKIEAFEHFISDNVRRIIEIELTFKSEADVNNAKVKLAPLFKDFTKDELKEYLNKYKELFTIRYLMLPDEVKLARMQVLSKLSLREPIQLTKPVSFIEFMVLSRLTEPFASSSISNFALEDFINRFVDEAMAEKKTKSRPSKVKKPERRKVQ